MMIDDDDENDDVLPVTIISISCIQNEHRNVM